MILSILKKTALIFTFAVGVLNVNAQCDEYFATIAIDYAVTCPGGSDGALSVEAFNGNPPYQYLWSNGATSATISGLTSGVYSVNVIDANQCITVGIGLLPQPQPFDFNIVSSPSGCNATTGELLVSATGGTGNLQYSLDGQNWQAGNFNSLESGLYPIYVIDALGCEGVTYATVSLIAGPQVSASIATENDCFNDCNASITGSAEDGLPPYFFNWQSIDGDGNVISMDQYAQSISNLCSGYYYAVVTDESGIGGGPEIFWSEDFGFGCNTGQLANGFAGANGTWTTTATGANDNSANTFFISATERIDANGCGIGCGGSNSRTLHLGNVAVAGLIAADGGATYNAGGLCGFGNICVITNLRAESPVINCAGRTNVELSFDYIEFGQGTVDNATLWYYDGSVWSLLVDLPKTTCCGGGCNGTNQGLFTNYTLSLPASANNNPNVKIGFNWVNNDDGVGTDPSFAVDNITLSAAGATVCPSYSPVVYINQPAPMQLFVLKFSEITCNGAEDGAIEVQVAGGQTPYSFLWSNGVPFSANLDLGPGEYTVTVTDFNGCEIEQTFVIEPDPAPETVDFDFSLEDLTVSFTNNSSEGNYSWDFGDGNTSDETNPSHTYELPGMYEVCLTLESVCGNQTLCEDITIVSTGILNMNAEFSAVPNPFSTQVTLNMGIAGTFDVLVFSVHGKLVYQEMFNSNLLQLNTSDWNSGLYLIQVIDRASGHTSAIRVVKGI
jgi:PKD repeat protein